MAGSLDTRSSGEEMEENHEINVTPFIDVMLVLLIIFMIAAPLATRAPSPARRSRAMAGSLDTRSSGEEMEENHEIN
ncbi:hypothetical protein CNY89_28290, partial [Amaricoccus sp. HAR-UPW-R2A-40]